MATYSTNEFKKGLRILLDGEPYIILEAEHHKPGKGHAFMKIKIRGLKNGRVLDKTYLSGDSVEAADASEKTAQYLYRADGTYHFMLDDGSFEQYEVSENTVGGVKLWLKEELVYALTVWNDEVIVVTPPQTVELEVTETDPGLKGDTATGGTKPAKLSTGANIKVPLFVKVGDIVKVNTQKEEYLGRA